MHISFFKALHGAFFPHARPCLVLLAAALWVLALSQLPIAAFAADTAPLSPSSSLQQDSPANQYEKAKKYVGRLEHDAELGKSRDNWLVALRNFRKIYLAEKNGAYSSPSLFMMARISQQVHARFQVPLDLDHSIEFFLELADHYPASSLADDSLYAAAESLRRHKPEDSQALELYQRIVSVYPKGNFYDRALERVNEEKLKSNPKGSRSVIPVLAKDPGYHLARILPIKYWSSKDYTRIVIQSSAPVHFDSRLLEKNGDRPRRLYLDFAPSFIQPAVREPIIIQDGLLKQVRTAQFDNSTVRVVLDLESLSDYKIFSLNDPFRVIVDVHGARPSQEERRASQEYREILEKALQKTPESFEEQSPEENERIRQVREIPEQPEEPVGQDEPNNFSPRSDSTKARIAVIHLQDQKKVPLATSAKQTSSGTARQASSSTKQTSDTAQASATTKQSSVPKKPGKSNQDRISSISLAQQLGLGVHRIVIDPGHGGKDPGAMGFGLKEKDIVLNVSKKLATILRKKNFEVELTRNTDIHIPLEERTAIANTRNADLFISVHINAHPDKKIGGVETYFLNLATDADAMRVAALENATSTHNISELQDILSNLMNNSKIDESSRLAHFVQTNLAAGLKKQYKIRNLGVKQAPFYVLIGAEMPAILVEISFISNPEEAKLLQNQAYLNTIAEQIVTGIVAYVHHHQSAAVRLQ